MTERITEDIVRQHFKDDPLFNVVKLEEQKSSNKNVVECLSAASKSGKGIGYPEFIITFPTQNSKYLIVIECKKQTSLHQSKKLNNPKDYAVDGVLHYGKILSKDYEVICIAISGITLNELKVSSFRWNQNKSSYQELKDKSLRTINDYIKLFDNEHFSESLKQTNIIGKAIDLNDTFQSYSVTENSRCTIVSAILLSLMDNTFRSSYPTYSNSADLAKDMLVAIDRVLSSRDVKNKQSMIGEYQKICIEPLFKEDKIKVAKKELETITEVKNLIINVHKNIYPLSRMDEAGYDVLGKFYTEFIRYAGSSQSQGLVLTPTHVTDLFCDLANITTKSVVYDPCCGSGGFLISSMKKMLLMSGNDNKQKEYIKNNQLVGVERRPDMFTYACSNMLFRGDGKSNIYCGDCFNLKDKIVKNHKPNIVFLNPPYDIGSAGQMEFIEHGLEVISNTGLVIAIVQMSCALKAEKELLEIKKRLMIKHRLKAVISMPDELFNPAASVTTCVMVWEANIPHGKNETWFGYLKEDGFEKRKHKGRIDVKKKWDAIKNNFLSAFHNQKEVAGLSVKKYVTENDEWCAEAYMETDYNKLNYLDFEEVVKKFYAFKYIYRNG